MLANTYIVFFFSSRRRHTRFKCDWSSDVCSSDLCDPLFSAASNLGPTNPAEIKTIQAKQKAIAAFDHVPVSQIPPDAVTASASGLDPDISPQNAAIQVNRVEAAQQLPASDAQAPAAP